MRLRRPCGYRLVRTCITRPTDTHYVVGVKLLCKLGFEASCANLIIEKRFKSPVTRKKYRHARFQVAVIHRSAGVVFVDDHRGDTISPAPGVPTMLRIFAPLRCKVKRLASPRPAIEDWRGHFDLSCEGMFHGFYVTWSSLVTARYFH